MDCDWHPSGRPDGHRAHGQINSRHRHRHRPGLGREDRRELGQLRRSRDVGAARRNARAGYRVILAWRGRPAATVARALHCAYLDLDGTLLGPGASLLRGADGRWSSLGVRALEACWRADVEVVLYSGRRQSSVFEGARLIGSSAYIFELGCGLVLDGELEWLTDGVEPSDAHGSIYDQIDASGAPALLLESYAGQLVYHTPWSA